MARITTYPGIQTIANEDLLLISDVSEDGIPTKTVSVAQLASSINVPSVDSLSTNDSTYINLTPNGPSTGDVTVSAELSATGLGSPSSNYFLRGDNTWAIPAGGAGTVTSVTPQANGADGTVITAAGNINFVGTGTVTTSISGDTVTIAGSGGFWTANGSDIYNNNYTTGSTVIGTNAAATDGTASLEVSGRISQVGLGKSTYLGFEAGKADDLTTNANVGIGYQSLLANITGSQNTALGYNALRVNVDGVSNVAVGYRALSSNLSGNTNIAIGANSLVANESGDMNIAIGSTALLNNVSGNNNITIGQLSMSANLSGSNNIAFGWNSLESNTTGQYNIGIGVGAGRENIGASDNISIGRNSGQASITGVSNLSIGTGAAIFNVSGSGNTTVGQGALSRNESGSNNTAIGISAGSYHTSVSGSTPNLLSTDCVYIGKESLAFSSGNTNEIVIGSDSLGNGSNTVTIGNASIIETHLKGVVSLGITTDYADNNAAIAGGLVIGQVYRTGDVLKVVH